MVRFTTPQITWHGGEGGKNAPVLSLDFHPSDRHLIVSGGADAEARVWLVDGESAEAPRYLYTLTGHELSINCVRWSPDGNSVAAGADGGMLIAWSLPAREDASAARKQWRHVASDDELKKKMFPQHDDVYDISWSPNGKLLAAASVNHMTCVWDVERRSLLAQLRDHSHFVQGVGWDPIGAFLATQSSDRTVRLYGAKEDKGLAKKRRLAAQKGQPNPCPDLPGWSQGDVAQLKCLRTLKHLVEPSPAQSEPGNDEAGKMANQVSAALAALDDQQQQQTPQQQTSQQQGVATAVAAATDAAAAATAIPTAPSPTLPTPAAVGGAGEELGSVPAPAADPVAGPVAAPATGVLSSEDAPAAAAAVGAGAAATTEAGSAATGTAATADGAAPSSTAPAPTAAVGVAAATTTMSTTATTAALPPAAAATTAATATANATATATANATATATATTSTKVPKPNLFADENVRSFFRRLDWTPDGALLLAPTGVFTPSARGGGAMAGVGGDAATGGKAAASYATWVFQRTQLDSPVACLPGLDKPSVAVRSSPRLYAPRQQQQQQQQLTTAAATTATVTNEPPQQAQQPEGATAVSSSSGAGGSGARGTGAAAAPPAGALNDIGEHRCVFAVMTLDDVLVYDTHQQPPLAVAKQLHYAALTDASWSADGRCLAVSSSDGYISIIAFAEAEIGTCLERSVLESWKPKSRFEVAAPPRPRITPIPVAAPTPVAAAAAAANAAAANAANVATGTATSAIAAAGAAGAAVAGAAAAVLASNEPAPMAVDEVAATAIAPAAAAAAAGTTAVASDDGSGASLVHVLQPKKKRRVAPQPVVPALAVSPVPGAASRAGGAAPMSLGDLVSPPLCPAPAKTGGGSPEAAAAASASDMPIKTATMPVVEVENMAGLVGLAGMAQAGASATSAINLDETMALPPPSMGLPGGVAGVAVVNAPKKEKRRITPIAVETNAGAMHQ